MTNREELEDIAKLFIDKCYFRDGRKRNPYFFTPNYQMTELQGAVNVAQLEKVANIVETRNRLGVKLLNGLAEIPGIIPQKIPEGSEHAFFLTVIRIDPNIISASPADFCTALKAEADGIQAEPYKITGGMPTYLYDVFQNRSAFPQSQLPFVSTDLGSDVSYPKGMCPNCEDAFEHTFNFNITEFYTDEDIDDMIAATVKVAENYRN